MKDRKLVTLNREVTDDIERRRKEEDFNFSDWIETTYIKENMTESGLKNQVDRHKKGLKSAENRLTYLKRKHQNTLNLYRKRFNQVQKEELEKTKKIIKNKPKLLDGRLRLWNNEIRFLMGNNLDKLTKSEFIELLDNT